MRGTLSDTLGPSVRTGIIPAYAGNTLSFFAATNQRRDHPRVCGEHEAFVQDGQLSAGSSPRMRGTHGTNRSKIEIIGIIPAYAGNTAPLPFAFVCKRDHPRVCGEHLEHARVHVSVTGSSPRMRGTRMGLAAKHALDGIIPAYAGNTLRRISYLATIWDHPRVCGEHNSTPVSHIGQKGSSPRMRGTLKPWAYTCAGMGIIPAYAGNT